MSRGEIVIVSMFKRHTIQVIDDDASIRDSTKLLLESFGFSVELFESATAYLDGGAVGNADCLLLDVHMPGMTGLELLEVLRSRKVSIPTIVMTANGDHLVARLHGAGAASLLRKPFDEIELVRQIKDACVLATPARK